MKIIFDIFKRAKLRISLVYLFCFLVNALWVLEPYVLGKMIDGILIDKYLWSILFIVMNLIFIYFGYVRRVLDTKVFSRLYNEVILSYIKKNLNTTDTSKIVARTEMSKVITSFLEDAIPTYITVLFGTVGSLIAVYLLSPLSAVLLVVAIIPSYFISKYFFEKTTKMTRIQNTFNELHVERIQTKVFKTIRDYFIRKRNLTIMESNLNAKNIVVFDFIGLIITFVTMVLYVSSSSCSVGDAISFYGYINRFIYTFSVISYCISTVVQIRDVSKRII